MVYGSLGRFFETIFVKSGTVIRRFYAIDEGIKQ
ncbi:hypothetical protein ABID22_001576 [Pontibacter aydingkolensis]